MNVDCLRHLLTAEERTFFQANGYLIVPEALSPSQVERLTRVVDRVDARERGPQHQGKLLSVTNVVHEDDAMVDLVTQPTILPKVWGILGWNIYLYHAHLIVTPPTGLPQDDKTFGWHQDSGRVNIEMESHPRPRLSLKVAYFLSDTSVAGRGNFWVIPGSHLWDTLERSKDGIGQPAGATPVLAKPGTAVFFDRRIWHTATPNWSDITRKVLFYGYGYRWIRTKDDMTVQNLWPQCDPIRKQMLGWGLNCNGFYSPTEEDVPLRSWLRQHQPGAAV